METHIGPQTPYEVYCYDCRVTFPVGTRTCVHCGRPIGRPAVSRERLFELAGMPGAPAPGLPGAGNASAEDGPDPSAAARKLGGASLWVLVALGAALSRYCSGS
jgi:hypothetical protein